MNKKLRALLLLLMAGFYSAHAQTEAERKQIQDGYKAQAIENTRSRGEAITDKATYDPFKVFRDRLKAEYELREARVNTYLQHLPGQQRNWTEDNTQYYIEDIRPDGTPVIIATKDTEAGQIMKATSLYKGGSLGLNIEGQGMTGGVWDQGKVRTTHELYENRAIYKDTSSTQAANTLSDHMCHVTGDMIGGAISTSFAGTVARGIASKATAWCYDWSNDEQEYSDFAAAGYLLSNHSYGPANTNANDPIWGFGAYNQRAANIDALISQNPYYLQCWAAGNEQSNNTNYPNKAGYDVMTGGCPAKNVLTVGAVNVDGSMSSFSNWGPADDGRIKPEICTKGVSLTSAYATNDNAYNTGNGTSFASPTMAGMVLLLQQYYKTLYPNYLEAAGVKGLILHAAADLGQPGPDYKFGWGMADAEKAAQLITTSNADFSLQNSETKIATITANPSVGGDATFTVRAKGGMPLSVSICWTDNAGSVQTESEGIDPVTSRLVYNFDIKVTAPGGTTVHYPWSGPGMANRTQDATRTGPNNVDPFKRVDIDTPVADGLYTITITKRNGSPALTRSYTLIASGLKNTLPVVNFNAVTNTMQEATAATTDSCVNYQDYTLQMTIASAPSGAATVTIVTDTPGTAIEGKDFDISTNGVFGAGGSKQLTFAAGATVPQTYTVRVYNDAVADTAETIRLSFTVSGGNATVGAFAPKTIITINDNDKAVTAPAQVSVAPGDVSGATVARSGPFAIAGNSDLLMDNYFLAAELSAMGLTAGSEISGLTLLTAGKQSTTPFPGFNIRMAHIGQGPGQSGAFLPAATPYVNCYSNASYNTTSGENTFNFTTPFVWNGTSNIVVRYCYSGTADRSSTDVDRVFAKPHALGTNIRSVMFNYEEANVNAEGCTLSTDFGASMHVRPITRFSFLKKGTAIETAIQSATESVRTASGQYDFYAAGSNKLIAGISNTTQEGGCTIAAVEASGNGFTTFGSAGMRSNKVWNLTPSSNASTMSYKVILYMTTAELDGQNPGSLKILKSTAPAATAMTPANTIEAVTTVTTNAEYVKFEATFTGFSRFAIGNLSTPLPLRLLSFTGSRQRDGNLLEWETADESGINVFEVETRAGNSLWGNIRTLNATGGAGNRSYAFLHNTPPDGRSFYRLKIKEEQGSFTYSPVVVIDRGGTNGIRLYPNPAAHTFTLNITDAYLNSEVQLFSADGKMVQSILLRSKEQQINIQSLAAGLYILRFKNGATLEVMKE